MQDEYNNTSEDKLRILHSSATESNGKTGYKSLETFCFLRILQCLFLEADLIKYFS